VWRRSRCLAWSGESGFALMETVAALVLLEIIAMAAVGLITVSLTTEGNSRQRVLAEQIASSQIESIRQLPYTSVGLVNGNPGGTVLATKTISIGALSATETTQIRWVTDATPNAFITKADYKRVTVTINRLSDGRQLTQQTTYVGPANQASYGGLNKAIAQVQVMDMGTNQPVSGVPVSLQTGPSAPQSDTTDGSGTVVFPALTANPASGGQAFYDLAITPPAGYSALTDDVSPAAAAHTKLAVSQTFSTVLRVYKPSTVGFTIVNAGGGTFPGAVTVTMTSSLKPVTTSFSGGIGSLGTVPPAQFTVSAATTNSGTGWATGVTSSSVVQTVPTSYPTNLTSAFTLTLPYLLVTVKQSVSGVCQVVPGATVTVTGGPGSVNMSVTADSQGRAGFVVRNGGSYTIKAVSGATNKTLTSQTVLAPPSATAITDSITGACP
jgi:hypothetical protein